MIFCDANVLVHAFRKDAEEHDAYNRWLTERLNGEEPVAISSVVASGFVRIVTHPRIFPDPAPVAAALEFVEALRQAPAAVPLREGERHWEIFGRLCRKVSARGNLVPDAHLAALAIESGATLYSADRGFARFPGLRWQHPMDEA
ncbi:type II toxin-antitoxin system VapC family toxin [Streptomyces sp. B-S-A8]|uniref:Ribonuclease VapC n=1 Tax=Streptomyces solicavernae TaxID=3043614 RepID=A0ABT6RZR9_9ACTN|nr:type II toxin-antitoxin system VapC family toxin [Streptomyces sp. B-S-A8]MDI3389941.1 type II toxin-antitoxin system VapC family toxin [Streptomyces sp. B-S-A8]